MKLKIWPDAWSFVQTINGQEMVTQWAQELLPHLSSPPIEVMFNQAVAIVYDGGNLKFSTAKADFTLGSYTSSQLIGVKTSPNLHSILSQKLKQALVAALTHEQFITYFKEVVETNTDLPATPELVEDKLFFTTDVGKPSAMVPPVLDTKAKQAIMKAKTVPLRNASQMYQPVQGTSAGSRYFVMALHEKIKVAARYTDSTLSIRVENSDGDFTPAMAHALSEAGLAVHKQYASLHINTETPVLARKALGAVMMATAVEFTTPWPDLKVIANAGA